MPETFRRRERGESNGSGRSPGHERAARPSSLPTRHPPLPRTAERLPALDPSFWSTLDDGLRHLRTELTAGSRVALDAHARLLLAWNEAINLTALRTAELIARGHVLDSLTAHHLCLELLGRRPGDPARARLLDLGSGGGYPGIPLAVVLRVARCALVDSVGKKAAFLEVAAAAAASALIDAGEPAPRFDILAERAEDLADEPDQREGWDLVTARAVGSLAEVAELGLPLLVVGGHLVAWKRDMSAGRSGLADELRASRRVIQAAGGIAPRVTPVPVADDLGLIGHVLVIVRKVRPTPDRYPRPPTERRRAALLP